MESAPRGVNQETGPSVTRMELYDLIRKGQKSIQYLQNYVQTKLSLNECPQDALNSIKNTLSCFKNEFQNRWRNCARKNDRFLLKYSKWLKKKVTFSEKVTALINPHSHLEAPGPSTARVGRPRKSFSDAGVKTKRKIVRSLMEQYSGEELAFATEMSLRSSGNRDASTVLGQITRTTPRRASKYKKAYKLPRSSAKPYTSEEALSLVVENKLTKRQYINIRLGAKTRGTNIYPSYKKVGEAKLACYPPREKTTVTDVSSEIELQALVDHTVHRLALEQKEVIERTVQLENKPLTTIFKWGCDGSSGHSQYKQRFQTPGKEYHSDSDMFVISIVPLQMYCDTLEPSKSIVWQNPRPSSTRYCRPIKLLIEKETPEISMREVHKIEEQIKVLQPTIVTINEKQIKIFSKLLMTMVDGKVCNTITGSSSQRCYICGCTPKEMNNTSSQKVASDVTTYTFGLSTLHAWIRFFECLLHISYRLTTKKWQIRENKEKVMMAQRKKEISQQFQAKMGLIVDRPKPGGSGNTNDGNTARRFFLDPELSASITGVDKELIQKFSIILRAISSGFPINIDKFNKFAKDTADLYLKLYPWYYMPVTVHKILIHGGQVIESAILPIGMLSEEAQEAMHKHVRVFRERHARKRSRKETMQDILNHLLLSSDPIITNLSQRSRKKKESLPEEVRNLLKEPKEITLRTYSIPKKSAVDQQEEEEGESEDDDEMDNDEDDDEDYFYD